MSEEGSVVANNPQVQFEQAKAYFNQAVGFMKANQYQRAERLLKRVVKIIPQHPNSHQLLSVIASEQGDLAQALKLINAAIAYQAGNPEFYYNRAMIYQKLDKLKKAALDLQYIIAAINPSYYPAYLALARVLHTQENYQQAVIYYEQSLKWVNTDPSVWADLTAAYQALQQYDKAIKCDEVYRHLSTENNKVPEVTVKSIA